MDKEIEFGKFIRLRRKGLKPSVTLSAFAARVYITPSYLSKIEHGRFDPPAEDIIVRIAEELDCNKDMLLAQAGKISSDLPIIIKENPIKFSKVIRAIRSFDEEEWDSLLKHIDEIVVKRNQEST